MKREPNLTKILTYLVRINLNKVYILKIKAGILKMKDKSFKKRIRGIKKENKVITNVGTRKGTNCFLFVKICIYSKFLGAELLGVSPVAYVILLAAAEFIFKGCNIVLPFAMYAGTCVLTSIATECCRVLDFCQIGKIWFIYIDLI